MLRLANRTGTFILQHWRKQVLCHVMLSKCSACISLSSQSTTETLLYPNSKPLVSILNITDLRTRSTVWGFTYNVHVTQGQTRLCLRILNQTDKRTNGLQIPPASHTAEMYSTGSGARPKKASECSQSLASPVSLRSVESFIGRSWRTRKHCSALVHALRIYRAVYRLLGSLRTSSTDLTLSDVWSVNII